MTTGSSGILEAVIASACEAIQNLSELRLVFWLLLGGLHPPGARPSPCFALSEVLYPDIFHLSDGTSTRDVHVPRRLVRRPASQPSRSVKYPATSGGAFSTSDFSS